MLSDQNYVDGGWVSEADVWDVWADGRCHHYVCYRCRTPFWLRWFGYPPMRTGHYVDGYLKRYSYERMAT